MRTNLEASHRALEQFIADTSIQKKGERKCLVLHKENKAVSVSYEKISGWTRFWAMLGFTNANLRKVFDFCEKNRGVFKDLTKDQVDELNRKIQRCAKKQSLFNFHKIPKNFSFPQPPNPSSRTETHPPTPSLDSPAEEGKKLDGSEKSEEKTEEDAETKAKQEADAKTKEDVEAKAQTEKGIVEALQNISERDDCVPLLLEYTKKYQENSEAIQENVLKHVFPIGSEDKAYRVFVLSLLEKLGKEDIEAMDFPLFDSFFEALIASLPDSVKPDSVKIGDLTEKIFFSPSYSVLAFEKRYPTKPLIALVISLYAGSRNKKTAQKILIKQFFRSSLKEITEEVSKNWFFTLSLKENQLEGLYRDYVDVLSETFPEKIASWKEEFREKNVNWTEYFSDKDIADETATSLPLPRIGAEGLENFSLTESRSLRERLAKECVDFFSEYFSGKKQFSDFESICSKIESFSKEEISEEEKDHIYADILFLFINEARRKMKHSEKNVEDLEDFIGKLISRVPNGLMRHKWDIDMKPEIPPYEKDAFNESMNRYDAFYLACYCVDYEQHQPEGGNSDFVNILFVFMEKYLTNSVGVIWPKEKSAQGVLQGVQNFRQLSCADLKSKGNRIGKTVFENLVLSGSSIEPKEKQESPYSEKWGTVKSQIVRALKGNTKSDESDSHALY